MYLFCARVGLVFFGDLDRLVAGKPCHAFKRCLPAVARFGADVVRTYDNEPVLLGIGAAAASTATAL